MQLLACASAVLTLLLSPTWLESPKEASEARLADSRPGLILFLGEEESEILDHFEEAVFPDEKVATLLERFVLLRVQSAEEKELAESYRLTPGASGLLYVDPYGRAIGAEQGKPEPKRYVRQLKKVLKASEAAVELHRELTARCDHAEKLRKKGGTREACQLYEHVTEAESRSASPAIDRARTALADLEHEAMEKIDRIDREARNTLGYSKGMAELQKVKAAYPFKEVARRVEELVTQYTVHLTGGRPPR